MGLASTGSLGVIPTVSRSAGLRRARSPPRIAPTWSAGVTAGTASDGEAAAAPRRGLLGRLGGGWGKRCHRGGCVMTRAGGGGGGTSEARARLDAIREEDELPVEDPGERGGYDLFSGGVYTPEVLQYWESTAAFFFPRLLLFGGTALGLAASIPQSIGGVARGDEDALSVLGSNVVFFVIAAAVSFLDLKTRKSTLDRLQRELAIGDMQVIQRDKFRNERVFPLQSLRQAARVALVYGDAKKVAADLQAATPFRRRLEQSRILVVPVIDRPRGGVAGAGDAEVADVGPGRWELLKDVVKAWPGAGAGRWLAWPTRNDAWAGYFQRLLESAGADPTSGGYVTVGVNGQVRGSGSGSPSWDVLLSTFPRNRPGNKADAAAEAAWKEATVDYAGERGMVDQSNTATATKLKDIRGEGAARPIGTTLELPREGPIAEVLAVHNAFYDALGKGDEAGMRAVWAPAVQQQWPNKPLDRFVKGGARLDSWETVLRPDRRPEGLKLSDVDVTVERGSATVTVLETVANGATLLASQEYKLVEGPGDMEDGNRWVLCSHFTVPYGADTVAKIALRCDERGCVAVPAKAVASEAPRS